MKAVILDGALQGDDTGERLRASLTSELRARGWNIEAFVLRENRIGDCAGDFLCWMRTPGICKTDDDNLAIAAAVATSDLLVGLTPLTFGGYSSALKRAMDHLIPNILPFFLRVEGETHHAKRYESYPDFLMIGWTDAVGGEAEAFEAADVFRHMVRRNALNFSSRTHVAEVVARTSSDEELAASAQRWLEQVERGESTPRVELPVAGPSHPGLPAPRNALLLVGSPRRAKSTSHSLGDYLLARLRERSVETRMVFTHSALASPEGTQAMLTAAHEADLVILATPLYVDSLPACVIESLERIAAARPDGAAGGPGREAQPPGSAGCAQRFTAIVNCGFPETLHNYTALAICRVFARQAGFEWAGGLALGGGEGLVHAKPLAECGGRAARIRRSLDLTADALAQGLPIPAVAQELMAKPVIPPWMYRLFGNYSWKPQAKPYGAQKRLRDRPYAATPSG